MNRTSVLLHLVILGVALWAAWATWTQGDEVRAALGEQGVVLVDTREGEVSALTLALKERTVTIEAREDDRGRWFWGKDTLAESGASKVFAGGSATRSLWKQLEPLRVLRVVADADEAKLQELGLAEGADPQGTLTLTIAGEAQVFALGDKAFGTADTFARAPDGRIVVLGSGLMKDLRIGAGRLMETALFESGRGDIDGLEVELADKGLAMRQHNPESRRQAFWSEPESDTPRGDFAAWVDKLLGLVAVDWLEVSAPQAGWEPVATVHVLRGASPYEKVRLFRATGDEGEPRWLALGDHGRLAAKLDRAAAEALVEDLGALVR